jgi:hypothetical protein
LPLIEKVDPNCLLGDKAYDVDAIRQQLQARDAVAVIPPKANRKAPAAFDNELYEKTLRNYVAVVAIGCAMLWLRI